MILIFKWGCSNIIQKQQELRGGRYCCFIHPCKFHFFFFFFFCDNRDFLFIEITKRNDLVPFFFLPFLFFCTHPYVHVSSLLFSLFLKKIFFATFFSLEFIEYQKSSFIYNRKFLCIEITKGNDLVPFFFLYFLFFIFLFFCTHPYVHVSSMFFSLSLSFFFHIFCNFFVIGIY